jgi:hypothetical protein
MLIPFLCAGIMQMLAASPVFQRSLLSSRQRSRWKNNIKMDLNNLEFGNMTVSELAWDWMLWHTFMLVVFNL